MNTSNEDRPKPDNMEQLKQQAACCGAGCDCHTSGSTGKMRWIVCGVVLVAAGALVVRAMTKQDQTTTPPPGSAFAAPVTQSVTAPVATQAEESATAPVEPVAAGGGSSAKAPVAAAKATATSAGTIIGSFSELNAAAAHTDAVFVYLPGKSAADNPPTPVIDAAVRTIQAKGIKCGIFTLKTGSPDYDQVATQVAVPGVLAMVKGKGMSAVSGEITETKLVQGYVAAANSAGCGSGGCGPSGCP